MTLFNSHGRKRQTKGLTYQNKKVDRFSCSYKVKKKIMLRQYGKEKLVIINVHVASIYEKRGNNAEAKSLEITNESRLCC